MRTIALPMFSNSNQEVTIECPAILRSNPDPIRPPLSSIFRTGDSSAFPDHTESHTPDRAFPGG